MQELDDSALLREYVESRSENAFATLVARHIDKVYSAALRHTRNPGHAQEITQAVFVILARKAPGLGKHTVLSGWLYQTARLTSVTFLRSEIRRAHREQEAHMQSNLHEPSGDDAWVRLAPLLDEAMATLGAKDRNAVVLRFFDGKSLKDVGATMAASEEATKKRVQRAVEKLRAFFMRRGITLSAAVICGILSSNAVQAAPTDLTVSVTAAASGSAVAASTLTLVKGVLNFMAWMKLKTAVIVGAVALVAVGTTTVAVKVFDSPSLPPIASTRAIPEWGDVVDPDGDCTLTMADGRLTIAVPGSDHVVMPERHKLNGPRVLKEVSGDFDTQVKVLIEFPQGAASVAAGRNPYQDAGLFVWVDEKTHLKFACAQQTVNRKTYQFLNLESRLEGKYRSEPFLAPPNLQTKTGHLRLQRRGDTITASASLDGENWYDLPPATLKLPKKVRVGVEVQHNTSSPLTVGFEEFIVTPAARN